MTKTKIITFKLSEEEKDILEIAHGIMNNLYDAIEEESTVPVKIKEFTIAFDEFMDNVDIKNITIEKERLFKNE